MVILNAKDKVEDKLNFFTMIIIQKTINCYKTANDYTKENNYKKLLLAKTAENFCNTIH